jgi:hypothetical protein
LFYNLILKNRKKKRRKGARERNLIRAKGTLEKKQKIKDSYIVSQGFILSIFNTTKYRDWLINITFTCCL